MSRATIDEAMQSAVGHHRAGQLQEAESIYRQILAVQPKHPDALHMLGVLAGQSGRGSLATELIRQAVAVSPGNPIYCRNLGVALHEQGQLDEAIAYYQKAVALKADYHEVHDNLGNALQEKGRLDEAIAAHQRALTFKPDYVSAHINLGNALRKKGQLDQAVASYQRALALNPDHYLAHYNLGNAWQDKGQLDQAIKCYERALAIKPDYPDALLNLGNALHDEGRLDEAIASFQRALALKPDFYQVCNNLGNALRDGGQIESAIASYQRALALEPRSAGTLTNLGNLWRDWGQLDEAIACQERALILRPDLAEAQANLGNAWSDSGEIDKAINCLRQAIALDPAMSRAHDNLLLTMHYHPAADSQGVFIESQRWNSRHAEPLRGLIRPHGNERSGERKLRVGYVSADFRHHSVAYFILPLLAAHDRQGFEIFCYADVPCPDDMTAKLRASVDTWRSIAGLFDERVAEMIRLDRIDILVDLAGHTAPNRLLAFARKPAPIQITYLGYPASSGLGTMDYRLTDALADPGGLTDPYCSEELIRLPRTAWCFHAPEDAPSVNMLPATKEGHVTFGSFNTFAKLNESTLKLWAKILQVVPGARLFLKAKSLNSRSVQENVRRLMAEAGIEAGRLDLCGWLSSQDHLARYGGVDIALDPYPYHGTTTTCESLWMGVPVITLAGQSHVSRVGVSLLSNVGLQELIAQTPEQYIQIAADLAKDAARLAELRSNLRRRMEGSPLMDAPGFARSVEDAYRKMWRIWCAKGV